MSPAVRARGVSDRMPREVWIVALIGFISVAGFGILSPSIPALGEEFGVGAAAMSVTVSGFALARLVTNLAFARYLKLMPLRTVLWVGLAFQGVLSVAASFMPEYLGFILVRSISGIGSAAFTTASTAFILRLVPPHMRGRGMAIFNGAFALGVVSGPTVGAALSVFGPRVPIFVYGFGLMLGAVITFFALRAARDLKTLESEPGVLDLRGVALFRATFTDRLVIAALVLQFTSHWTLATLRTANLPLHLYELGFSTALIGILLTVAAGAQLAGSAASGPYSDRHGRRIPAVFGMGLGLLAFGALLIAGHELWVAIMVFALIGLAGGALATVTPTILSDSPRGTSAMAISTFWVVSDLSGVLGPFISGIVTDVWDFNIAIYIALALLIAGIIAAATVRRPAGGGEGLPPQEPRIRGH